MALFESVGDGLYIDGKKVIKGWESFGGWYWFATEKADTQDSVLPSGKVIENDTLWFGFVQGFEEEWGCWSEGELSELIKQGKLWEIPRQNLSYSGRRR